MQYESDKFQSGIIEEYLSRFNHLTTEKITLLEIGIYKGGSLSFWADYFKNPETKIIGIDINPPDVIFPSNVIVYQCNQNDTFKLRKIAEEHGPFNLIIDDGSHQRKETENCFKVLLDYVSTGGYYVIEDWAVGYWRDQPHFKGMVELVTKIIETTPQLKIEGMNVMLGPHKAIAFFQKGDTGWRA